MIVRFGWLMTIFLLCVSGPLPAQELHLKAGNPLLPDGAPRVSMPSGLSNWRHVLVQYDHSPNEDDRAALQNLGAKILSAVPDDALMVAVPAGVSLPQEVQWTSSLQVREKLSDQLLPLGWNAVVVEFHSDVTSDVQDRVGAAEGFYFVHNSQLRAGHVLAFGAYSDLAALAMHDEVAYVFPADATLRSVAASGVTLRPCVGMLTQNGPVAQYSNIVHGWDVSSDGAAHLSYVFGEITPKLPVASTEAEIVRAMAEWAKNANILFQPGTSLAGPRTILVKFTAGAHGDPYPFDGPGGVLAHTFYPVPVNAEPLAGDMHLDADENWHIGGDIDLYSVVLHELGHAIGLGHSDVPGDVMYPYYRTGMHLSANDIASAQKLYGPAAGAAISANPAPVSTPVVTTPVVSTPTVPAPVLTLNGIASAVSTSTLTLTGLVRGGSAPVNITWQTDHGSSGKVTVASDGSWAAGNVTLQPGTNVLTVSAMDAQHRAVTQSATVAYLPPPATSQTWPLSISVQSPSGSSATVSTPTLTVLGAATGGKGGVSRITWETSTGMSGTASGISQWVASGIPLFVGSNMVVVKAWDQSGSMAWSSLMVVRH